MILWWQNTGDPPERGREWDFALGPGELPEVLSLSTSQGVGGRILPWELGRCAVDAWERFSLLRLWQGALAEGMEEIPVGWVVWGKPWMLGRPGVEAPQVHVGLARLSCEPWAWHGPGVGAQTWVSEEALLQHLARLGCTRGTDFLSSPWSW